MEGFFELPERLPLPAIRPGGCCEFFRLLIVELPVVFVQDSEDDHAVVVSGDANAPDLELPPCRVPFFFHAGDAAFVVSRGNCLVVEVLRRFEQDDSVVRQPHRGGGVVENPLTDAAVEGVDSDIPPGYRLRVVSLAEPALACRVEDALLELPFPAHPHALAFSVVSLPHELRGRVVDLLAKPGGQGQDLIVITHDSSEFRCGVALRPDRGAEFADRRQLRRVAHEDELDMLGVGGLLDKAEQVGVNHRGLIDNHGTILGEVKRVFGDCEFLDLAVGFKTKAQQAVNRSRLGLVLIRREGVAEDLGRLVRRGGEDQPTANQSYKMLDAIRLPRSGVPAEEKELLFGISQKLANRFEGCALFKCESHYSTSFSGL